MSILFLLFERCMVGKPARNWANSACMNSFGPKDRSSNKKFVHFWAYTKNSEVVCPQKVKSVGKEHRQVLYMSKQCLM